MGPDGMADWVEHASPVLEDHGIWISLHTMLHIPIPHQNAQNKCDCVNGWKTSFSALTKCVQMMSYQQQQQQQKFCLSYSIHVFAVYTCDNVTQLWLTPSPTSETASWCSGRSSCRSYCTRVEGWPLWPLWLLTCAHWRDLVITCTFCSASEHMEQPSPSIAMLLTSMNMFPRIVSCCTDGVPNAFVKRCRFRSSILSLLVWEELCVCGFVCLCGGGEHKLRNLCMYVPQIRSQILRRYFQHSAKKVKWRNAGYDFFFEIVGERCSLAK